jgi:hypothetical protein
MLEGVEDGWVVGRVAIHDCCDLMIAVKGPGSTLAIC